MRVLVTGATGRVGRVLVPMLLDQGHEVRSIQRGITGSDNTLLSGVDTVTGSIADRAVVDRAMAGVDAVCHLAALMPPHSDEDLFAANVVGTFNILEAVRASSSMPRLVQISTDATYGTGLSRRAYPTPIVESTPAQPTNFYGITKVVCEDLVLHSERLFDMNAIVLRFAWVLAADEVLDLFSTAMWSEFMTPGQQKDLDDSDAVPVILEEDGSPFSDHIVDPRDAAQACLLAVTSSVTGEALNVCGPAAFRYVDHSPTVAQRLGRPMVEVPLESFHSYAFDLSRTQEALGYRPAYGIDTVLEEALALA